MNRELICAKDIQIITGKCIKSARRILNKMKAHFNKEKHQFITIRECGEYFGMKYEEVLQIILRDTSP